MEILKGKGKAGEDFLRPSEDPGRTEGLQS